MADHSPSIYNEGVVAYMLPGAKGVADTKFS